jgi:hypothetical protein
VADAIDTLVDAYLRIRRRRALPRHLSAASASSPFKEAVYAQAD